MKMSNKFGHVTQAALIEEINIRLEENEKPIIRGTNNVTIMRELQDYAQQVQPVELIQGHAVNAHVVENKIANIVEECGVWLDHSDQAAFKGVTELGALNSRKDVQDAIELMNVSSKLSMLDGLPYPFWMHDRVKYNRQHPHNPLPLVGIMTTVEQEKEPHISLFTRGGVGQLIGYNPDTQKFCLQTYGQYAGRAGDDLYEAYEVTKDGVRVSMRKRHLVNVTHIANTTKCMITNAAKRPDEVVQNLAGRHIDFNPITRELSFDSYVWKPAEHDYLAIDLHTAAVKKTTDAMDQIVNKGVVSPQLYEKYLKSVIRSPVVSFCDSHTNLNGSCYVSPRMEGIDTFAFDKNEKAADSDGSPWSIDLQDSLYEQFSMYASKTRGIIEQQHESAAGLVKRQITDIIRRRAIQRVIDDDYIPKCFRNNLPETVPAGVPEADVGRVSAHNAHLLIRDAQNRDKVDRWIQHMATNAACRKQIRDGAAKLLGLMQSIGEMDAALQAALSSTVPGKMSKKMIERAGTRLADNIHDTLCNMRVNIIIEFATSAKVPPGLTFDSGDITDVEDEDVFDSDVASDDEEVEYVDQSPEEAAHEAAEASKDNAVEAYQGNYFKEQKGDHFAGDIADHDNPPPEAGETRADKMEVDGNGQLQQPGPHAGQDRFWGNEGFSDDEIYDPEEGDKRDDSDAKDMPKLGVLNEIETKIINDAYEFIGLWHDCANPVYEDSLPYLTPHILGDIIDGIYAKCGLVITKDDNPEMTTKTKGELKAKDVAAQYRSAIAGVRILIDIEEFMKTAYEVMRVWMVINGYALATPVDDDWHKEVRFTYRSEDYSMTLTEASEFVKGLLSMDREGEANVKDFEEHLEELEKIQTDETKNKEEEEDIIKQVRTKGRKKKPQAPRGARQPAPPVEKNTAGKYGLSDARRLMFNQLANVERFKRQAAKNLGLLIADDPGMGKTISAIACACSLVDTAVSACEDPKRCKMLTDFSMLIICPAGLRADPWEKEIRDSTTFGEDMFTFPTSRVTDEILDDLTCKRYRVVILSVGMLTEMSPADEAKLATVNFNCVVVDEVHDIGVRGKHTVYQKLKRLINGCRAHHTEGQFGVVFMSGTPIIKDVTDQATYAEFIGDASFQNRNFWETAIAGEPGHLKRVIEEAGLKPALIELENHKIEDNVDFITRTTNDTMRKNGTVVMQPLYVYEEYVGISEPTKDRIHKILDSQYPQTGKAPAKDKNTTNLVINDNVMARLHLVTSAVELAPTKPSDSEACIIKVNDELDGGQAAASLKYQRIFDVATLMHNDEYRKGEASAWKDRPDENGESIMDGQKRKIIIFSHYKSVLRTLAHYFSKRLGKAGPHFNILEGSNTPHGRANILDTFKNSHTTFDKTTGRTLLDFKSFEMDHTTILFANTSSGGTGLNLQHASAIIFADAGSSDGQYKQFIARAWRIGQTRDVRVAFFIPENHVILSNLPENNKKDLQQLFKDRQGLAAVPDGQLYLPTIESLFYQRLLNRRSATLKIYNIIFDNVYKGSDNNDVEEETRASNELFTCRNTHLMLKAYGCGSPAVLKKLNDVVHHLEEAELRLIKKAADDRAAHFLRDMMKRKAPDNHPPKEATAEVKTEEATVEVKRRKGKEKAAPPPSKPPQPPPKDRGQGSGSVPR